MTAEKIGVLLAMFFVITKVIIYCFTIWELFHSSWINAIASVLIAEFLGWVGKEIVEIFED